MNDSNLRQKSAMREWRPLPTDRMIYRDLPSHVVDWTMLEDDLGNRGGFSGVVEIVAGDRLGRVYYLESQAVGSHVLMADGWHRALGTGSAMELLRDPEARLSVFGLEAAVSRLSMAAPNWNLLRSAPADPALMLEWLDDLELNAFTGELEISTERGAGSVLFEYGLKVLISFTAPDTPPVFGLDALNMHKVAARWPEAVMRVLGRETATATVKPSAPIVSSPPVGALPVVPEPRPGVPAPPSPAVEVRPQDMIVAWREVLEFTEFRTDSARGKGSFDTAWRAVCLELVDRYPQLDPFLEDVRYTAGNLSIARPNGASFEALGAAYHGVLGKLNVPSAAVRPLLVPLRDKYRSVWREAQLEVVCPL